LALGRPQVGGVLRCAGPKPFEVVIGGHFLHAPLRRSRPVRVAGEYQSVYRKDQERQAGKQEVIGCLRQRLQKWCTGERHNKDALRVAEVPSLSLFLQLASEFTTSVTGAEAERNSSLLDRKRCSSGETSKNG
jgi:hypothetical protein